MRLMLAVLTGDGATLNTQVPLKARCMVQTVVSDSFLTIPGPPFGSAAGQLFRH